MSQVIEKITQELAAFNQKKKDLTEDLRKEFPTLFKDLFAQSAKIESFSWTQYTPYFNDGDECVFGVNNDEVDINGESSYDRDEDTDFLSEKFYRSIPGGGYKYDPNPNYDHKEAELVTKIEAILQTIPSEFYQELFGDHVKVTVNKDGTIETEQYSHD